MDNKENIPLSNLFEQWENADNSDDESSCVEVGALRLFPICKHQTEYPSNDYLLLVCYMLTVNIPELM